jgi:hypothetical protein
MSDRRAKGYRYRDEVLLHFALNSFLMGGRRFYETTNENFPGVFPCVRTIETKLKKFDTSAPEGQERTNGSCW